MAKNLPPWYVDTCVLSSLVKDEQIIVDDHTRGKWSQWLFEQAERGEITLVTSAFTIVEHHGGGSEVSQYALDKIAAIFDADYIIPAYLTPDVALLARDIIWDLRLNKPKSTLKSADAIHLASAIAGGCSKLITWDNKDLVKLDSRFSNITITTPNQVVGVHQAGLDIESVTLEHKEGDVP